MFPDISGKGVFIWHPSQICKGDPERIADEAERAGVVHACVKIMDGIWNYAKKGENPIATVKALRRRGIRVSGWGGIYCKWYPKLEAQTVADAIDYFEPEFFLIDAEDGAKYQFNGARAFTNEFSRLKPMFPMGMCSYWYPPYHQELPWKEFRTICHFDAPQVYWRGWDPVGKLQKSKKVYAAMTPRLPYLFAGGDLYFENNVKPTPTQVTMFLEACRDDPEIKGVLMWAMDQNETTPELWKAFSDFEWNVEKAIFKSEMHGFFQDATKEYDAQEDVYYAMYTGHKSAGTLPDPTDRDHEDLAVVAGVRKILS